LSGVIIQTQTTFSKLGIWARKVGGG